MANPPNTKKALKQPTASTKNVNARSAAEKRPAPAGDENDSGSVCKCANTSLHQQNSTRPSTRPALGNNANGGGQQLQDRTWLHCCRKLLRGKAHKAFTHTNGIEALAKERANNTELQEKLDEAEPQSGSNNTKDVNQMIPRPKGTAGTNFSTQVEMGLSGTMKKYDKYKAIQRSIHDLALNARINWEQPWADVPSKDKALLYDIARERNPYLARFVNDWAMEELVKQYMKNKHKNHYENGWLEVPKKYAYLRDNSSKHDPSASRKKKALLNSGAARQNRNEGRATDSKNQRPTKRVIVDDDDDEEEEEEEEDNEDGNNGNGGGSDDD